MCIFDDIEVNLESSKIVKWKTILINKNYKKIILL